jgi:septal ring factor EnvC (AmiA/AmiB activator)
MFKQIVVLLMALAIATTTAFAQQTKEEIQKKQQQLQRELADLNSTLSDIKKSKKQSLSQLALVQRKIKAREELVNSINKQLRNIDDEIYQNNLDIYRYKKELDTLKANYAKSLVFAYRNRSSYDYLNFIFSANSFNDAMKRVAYLKSYRQYRETQVDNILKTQNLLQTKMNNLKSSKTEKSNTLQEQGKQLQQMESDRKEKDEAVEDLKGQEKELAGQIQERERTRKKLNNQLQDIIRREVAEARRKEAERQAQIAKQKEEERKRKLAEQQAQQAQANNANSSAANSANNTPPAQNNTTAAAPTSSEPARNTNRTYSPLESTQENLTASINFEKGQGHLPWPVSAGTVVTPFGNYEIPGTKLHGSSDGIDIAVPTGTIVKAVADGEVSAVVDLGDEQMVVVRHGKYFTTYSHLGSVSVNRNDKVQAGTVIGRAANSDDGGGMVTFMVSNERGDFLNPTRWLSGR